MREILSIHIGQAGAQMGNQCWELFCLEHGIDKDGSIPPEAVALDGEDHSFETFFSETSPSKFVPRTVFIDLEPSVLDEIRTGPYKDLYHQDSIISGKEDAANNFARGKYRLGPEILDQVMHRITRITETCEGLQGFVVYHSFAGGTGSGFGSLLMEKISEEYNKKTKMLFNVFPSERLCNVTVEPYNSVFCTSSLSEYCDIAFLVDNQAMFDICVNNLNVDMPKYPNINRLAAQVVSNITCSLRFESQLNCDLTQFQTNLVPMPKVIFPVCSFFPFLSAEKAFHEQFSVRELTTALFDSRNAMVKCDTTLGKYMACCIIFRGDVLPKDMNDSIKFVKESKKTIQFVDWCPTGFKVGINNAMPTTVPGSDIAKVQRNAVMMSNTTAFGQVLARQDGRFDKLYGKKAFVFWYVGEGMEEGEFEESRENLRVLEDVYGELAREGDGGEEDADPNGEAGEEVY